jgi:hypothetical protein
MRLAEKLDWKGLKGKERKLDVKIEVRKKVDGRNKNVKTDTNKIWLSNIIYVSFYIQGEPKAPVHSAARQKVPRRGRFRWRA